jgi:hypothetical protein
MLDPLPWWANVLRFFGWSVDQEFVVLKMDHQKCPIVWTDGMPSRADAEKDLTQGHWVRRIITIYREDDTRSPFFES